MRLKFSSITVLGLMLLGGCASDNPSKRVQPPCPKTMIVAEVSESQLVTPHQSLSYTLSNVWVQCPALTDTQSSPTVAHISLRLNAKRSRLTMRPETFTVPYFIAITDLNDQPIYRQDYMAELTFAKDLKRVTPVVNAEVALPKGSISSNLRLYVGLDISQQQLDRNIQKRAKSY